MRWFRHVASAFLLSSAFIVTSLLVTEPRTLAATACENLNGLTVIGFGTITSAARITAPFQTNASSGAAQITVSAAFPFCKVTASLKPTSDSDVQMEIWMPEGTNWNSKFLGVGNGALTGAIWHTSMVRPLQTGYAVASSNLGHNATNANWALGHPEQVIDYAHRGDHVTAEASKAIINIYYGGGLERSYYHGCSNGGHQALNEAQRYPADYDAIIAGAPWNQWVHQNIEFISRAIALEALLPDKRAMITAAVNAQCGGKDGGVATDGYLNAPQRCNFKPKSLLCTGADGPDCLTQAEVDAVEKVYQGPVNPETKLSLFPGFERGSEFGWSGFGSFSNNLFQNMIFGDPTFDFHTFDFAADTDRFDAAFGDLINSANPDLSAFRRRGGKLLMWHGWTDTTLEPRSTVNYYNSLVAVTGNGLSLDDLDDHRHRRIDLYSDRRRSLEKVQRFVRLFMAPGVNHCGGGLGPNSSFAYTLGNAVGAMDADHDILAALDRWVEDGIAPDQLISSHFTAGVADKTRPICAYPKLAVYKGRSLDPNLPTSWACVNDWDQFNDDYTQVLENIRFAVKNDNFFSLPNGGRPPRIGGRWDWWDLFNWDNDFRNWLGSFDWDRDHGRSGDRGDR